MPGHNGKVPNDKIASLKKVALIIRFCQRQSQKWQFFHEFSSGFFLQSIY